ncbi:hypothetical protein C3B61_14990 [Cryobacterium zongtaii]|uniref:DUF4232 domain-containing protein n=1 Tax=Cryobacterium zongtaii TaxID=1259217 RepID=A0A2S3ZBH1_9MICO|nr:DUF4232 domain-containing protein [Cryobacterium zongtaii]POH62981.1 hypothetical protein C3B61_14990 [Cryobacterium zongtaii]
MNTRSRRSTKALVAATVLLMLGALTGCSLSPAEGNARTPAADKNADSGTCEFTATRESSNSNHPHNTALFYVKLTNTGATSCTVSGFPEVALLDAAGQVIDNPATKRDTIPAHTITVTPQDAAYLLVRVAGQNLYPDCPLLGAGSLRIGLPQSSAEILIDVIDLTICDAATSGWLIYNLADTPIKPHP